jgi:hypothetical protein
VQSITVGGKSYNLVDIPNGLEMADISMTLRDTVASVVGAFTQQTQTQYWGGGETWSGRLTLPPMKAAAAAPWKAFLAGLQGMQNVFQLGDPDGQRPQGSALGTPVTAGTNAAMATQLATSGWNASQSGLLLPGDYLQIGYRLYMVLYAPVDSDASGNATFSVWPSLREAPAVGTQVVLYQPKGLFRLAKNDRGWTASPRRPTTITIDFEEVR